MGTLSLSTRAIKNNRAPVKIMLVQQLSNFQRAPQGYLKELSNSKKSIAHIYGEINLRGFYLESRGRFSFLYYKKENRPRDFPIFSSPPFEKGGNGGIKKRIFR